MSKSKIKQKMTRANSPPNDLIYPEPPVRVSSSFVPRPQSPTPLNSLNHPATYQSEPWTGPQTDLESFGTIYDDSPSAKAGPAGPRFVPYNIIDNSSENATIIVTPGQSSFSLTEKAHPHVPSSSFASSKEGIRTNLGNTKFVMGLLSELWIFNIFFILGGTFLFTFYVPQFYVDDELWNTGCYWKLAWILPLPFTLISFFSLALPFRTPKFLYNETLPKRRCDNLYILTVTKGDNREAVYRSWNAHKHLEHLHPSVRVHVLTDEPYYFENINCYTCPKNFTTENSKYKARALEWYRQTMRYTEYDWILHLDEESVIDDESVKRVLEFIWYETDYHWGQGVILYNQYKYWTNWIFSVADALRVGDDLARFHLQYTYFHNPVFGAHGSFLLTNGIVENSVTWDLGSLTEDYQFVTHAWSLGYKCGKIPGLVREQSPLDIMGFLKQRRRWYVGIRRLPNFLPKLWATLWAVGSLSLYGTVASIFLGFFIPLGTPRWFGLIKDFSFVTFVYLYILGIFIQDLDKGTHPLLTLLRIPVTVVIQFIAVILESVSVIYGIILPPTDFDVIKNWNLLSLQLGEEELIRFNEVEDVKGNSGLYGILVVTNARIIWYMTSKKLNLSIGWDSITGTSFGNNNNLKQIILFAKSKSKFEFIFKSIDDDLFNAVESVFNGYKSSVAYRNTLIKSNVIIDGALKILRHENIMLKIDGVFHLSADEGVIGIMYVTNIRVIWHSLLDNNQNISIAYYELASVITKVSKYGQVLAFETKSRIKNYSLGFRVDPCDKLILYSNQIKQLWKLYQDNPIFGVEAIENSTSDNIPAKLYIQDHHEDLELILDESSTRASFNPTKNTFGIDAMDLVYDEYLGLAIQPTNGESTKNLWLQSF